MTRKIFSLVGLAGAIAFSSCETEENLNTQGPVPAGDFPTATLSGLPGSITMVEEDMSFEIAVTLDKAFAYDAEVLIEQIGGDATSDDIEATGVRIDNGGTSGTITIDVHADDVPEATKTATFRIYASSNVKMDDVEFTITLENYVSPDLDVEVTWGGAFNGETADDLIDYDVYIYDADFNVVDAAETGGFESMTLAGDNPDGDYYVYAFLWADFDPGDFGPIDMPITTSFSRAGVFGPVSLGQTEDMVLTTDANSYVEDGTQNWVPLAIITLDNGVYTVKNLDDITIIQGLAEKLKNVEVRAK